MEKEVNLFNAETEGMLEPQTLLEYAKINGRERKQFRDEMYTIIPIFHPILYYGIHRHTIDAYFTADKKGLFLVVTHRSNGQLKMTGIYKLEISDFNCYDFENIKAKTETTLISFKLKEYELTFVAVKHKRSSKISYVKIYVNKNDSILEKYKNNPNEKLTFTDQEN